MDLKNKNRSVVGILVITLIFGFLSVFSVVKMFSNNGEEEKLKKTDYVLLLEKELEIDLTSEDDFTNFESIDFEMVVEPTKYQNYYKPCFDFVIVRDGVILTNRLTKEFDSIGFKTGMKIVKINDEVLLGKSYFEILDLIYSKKLDETRKFIFSDGTEITYQYQNYYSSLEYNEIENKLYVYNLDNLTPRSIHDIVTEHEDLTLDLSMATVTTYEGIVNFLSLFSNKDEVLFKTPENIIGQPGRKINNLNIVVKDNTDEGILFALTCIKTLNSNITIDKTDLNTTQFYVLKIAKSANYTIYLKNYLLQAKSASNNNGEVLL